MKLTINQLKKFAIALFILPLLATVLLSSAPVRTRAARSADAIQDPAALYTANKCAMCHGATAAKNFDPAKPEAEMIDAILKGKKGEKPPNMPAYEPKGITAGQAKGLIDYMKKLRGAASE